MSYSGYVEILCKKGHYHTYVDDTYTFSRPKRCDFCGETNAFYHSVNITNGYDETDPHTYQAKLEEIGSDDVWLVDHYGNKYAQQRKRFQPAKDSGWLSIPLTLR